MRRRHSVDVPQVLCLARREIEQWRRRQSGRKRLPRELWVKAAALAREHEIHLTARTLGLKCASLRKHLGAGSEQDPPPRAKPDFIELLPGGVLPLSPECTIEWEEGDGVKMRMHLKEIGVPELVSLARAVRGGRA
jgi:signal recognition particle subunit SEC65